MFSETIELRGHIIDSLILPKVLDQILTHGAHFKIGDITIGQNRVDQSFARIEVSAETSDALDELILRLRQHGAEVAERADAQLAPAPADGVFPPEFYVMTNQQTFIRVDGKEIEVRPTMMDTAIAVDRKRRVDENQPPAHFDVEIPDLQHSPTVSRSGLANHAVFARSQS